MLLSNVHVFTRCSCINSITKLAILSISEILFPVNIVTVNELNCFYTDIIVFFFICFQDLSVLGFLKPLYIIAISILFICCWVTVLLTNIIHSPFTYFVVYQYKKTSIILPTVFVYIIFCLF